MIWVYFVLRMLLLLAVVGVGATVVRQAHSRSGILLAAAGGLELLFSCCLRGVSVGVDRFDNAMVFTALGLVGTLVHVVSAGLIVGALLGLAKELSSRKQDGGGAPPAQF